MCVTAIGAPGRIKNTHTQKNEKKYRSTTITGLPSFPIIKIFFPSTPPAHLVSHHSQFSQNSTHQVTPKFNDSRLSLRVCLSDDATTRLQALCLFLYPLTLRASHTRPSFALFLYESFNDNYTNKIVPSNLSGYREKN